MDAANQSNQIIDRMNDSSEPANPLDFVETPSQSLAIISPDLDSLQTSKQFEI